MTDLVDPTEIEQIVGAKRDPLLHIGHGRSSDQQFFILHSQACFNSGADLRECDYSKALDNGILDVGEWQGRLDEPQPLTLTNDGARLFPLAALAGSEEGS